MSRPRSARVAGGRNLRLRFGSIVLLLVSLVALFAEFIAADGPWLVVADDGVHFLPSVSAPTTASPRADDFTLGPWIPCGPQRPCAVGVDAPPSLHHPLGTDDRGRDVAARVIYGARTALGVAALALLMALVFGGLFGVAAAMLGGAYDEWLARPVELAQTFPAVIVVMIVVAVRPDATLMSLALAVAALRWAEIARLVRGEIIRLASEPYVMAGRAMGCSRFRLLRRYLLPALARPLLVSLSFGIVSVIIIETSAAFLGAGLDVSWGSAIAELLDASRSHTAAHASLCALAVTLAAAHGLADGVAEIGRASCRERV
jgi:peptide/nickel transport system permease protein